VIGRVLDALTGRVSAADVVMKTDDTLTLAISPDGETRVGGGRSRATHLRVLRAGRAGCAVTRDDDVAELVGHAMMAAASGEEIELFLPAPSPLAEVSTSTPQAAAAETAVLDGLARALLDRLVRSNRRVEVWAERSHGSVRVANTRGVLAGYDVTLAGVGAVVEFIGAGWAPPCRVHLAGAALPTLFDVEGLVAEVSRRLDPPLLEMSRTLPASMPVCLAPRALATFLRPLRAALLGHEAWLGRSPLRGRRGEQLFDEKLSLTDDPLAPRRPGSRPVDDEGVPSQRLRLVERGRLLAFATDLSVGVRANAPSTGHGWRLPSAAPRVGFTNLRVEPGSADRDTLLAGMGSGLLIEDLDWGAGPNPLVGTIALRAPWAYLVDGGEVSGRLEGVVLTGNAFDALGRILAVGSHLTWIGAQCLPSMVVAEIGVAVR
jgi:PmbA protein